MRAGKKGDGAPTRRWRDLGAAALLLSVSLTTSTTTLLGRPPLGLRGRERGSGAETASAARVHRGPVIAKTVKTDASRPLRRIEPVTDTPPPPEREEFMLPGREEVEGGEEGEPATTEQPQRRDPVAQTSSLAALAPAATKSFDGLGQNDNADIGIWAMPPDTVGDVGPSHYVQWVNLSFAIFDKNGTKLYGPAAGNTPWSGFGGACENSNDGDPIVLYDELADRWLMSQFAWPSYPSGPSYQCIAVSQTSNPLGAWNRYSFQVSATKLGDYPKFGVWPDGYYMSANLFNGSRFAGQYAVVFERSKMLAGQQAKTVSFDLGGSNPDLGGMLPADVDGQAPPVGAPNYFVQIDDDDFGYAQDALEIWQFHVDWNTPSSSTFTKAATLPTASFHSNLCDFGPCFPQPGTTRRLDPLSDRLMYRLQYRNFGTHQTLVVDHTVDVGNDHAGVRWYEVRKSGGGWGINQQGTYAPDANHRWMGSAAMDSSGDIAMGYSVSGSGTYPSVRYTGRTPSDPAGTMQAEVTLVAGGGSQTDTSGRWGDYSSLSVDPTDDCTFWYTQEYYAQTSSSGFATRIGSFRFPGCAGGGGGGGGDDTTAPVVAMTGPSDTFQKSNSFNVSWSGTDTGSGMGSFAVSVREAAADGDFGAWDTWLPAATGTGASFTGYPGTTYCFRVAGTDLAGNSSAPSSQRCTAVPLDDPQLAAGWQWSRRTGTGYYLGTFSKTTSRGATLTYSNAQAKQVGVLFTKCYSCGRIEVTWNGLLLGRISLYSSSTQKARLFTFPAFTDVQTGTLKIKVISSGLAVKIEGAGISRV